MVDPTSLDAPSAETLRLSALERELEALYRSHWPRLVRYFRQMGQPEGVAVELAQDSFIQALRALPQFRAEARLSTWVWAIAHSTLLAHVRRVVPPMVSSDDPQAGVDLESLSFGTDPHLSAQTQARHDCVQRGFRQFAAAHPERAEAIVRAHVEGFTREELAESLGRTLQAATEYLSQSIRKLRPFLQPCCDD
jgi:RNA polymerase sigma factor (sigma-70 family)